MNILIRTDASIEIGTGHVMRCITLAKQLAQKGAEIKFICRKFPGNSITFIQSEGFPVEVLSSNNIQNHWEWISQNWNIDMKETKEIINNLNRKVDLLIVDHYSIDEKWESAIRSYVGNIMVIDDLANRPHDCDILLDQNFYLDMKNRYQGLVSDSCIQLLGPEFVLLREEFLSIDIQRIKRNGLIKNVLVFFGGTDPSGGTLEALRAIQELELSEIEFHVVVGDANPKKEEIEQICAKVPNAVYHCQIRNIAELMVQTDLFIGAGGSTTWERCLLGLPSMTIIIAENQYEVTKAVANKGATISLGRINQINKGVIKKELISLIQNPDRLQELSKKSSELVNWNVVKKYPVANIVMELCV